MTMLSETVQASPYGGTANGIRQKTVVVADDDPRLRQLIRRNLELEGFRVLAHDDGIGVLDQARNGPEPDLYVLDVMMPGLDGVELTRELRKFSISPILMLTAKDAEDDKVAGLEAGADDYVTKPFGAQELLARVRAVLRRATVYDKQAPTPQFALGDLMVDFAQYRAFICGRPVELTPTEYKLLAHLARNAGRVVTQDDLLTSIWGPAYRGEAHLLRVNIARLRQKIERDPGNPKFVVTRPGLGYTVPKQLAPSVEPLAALAI